MLKIKQFYDDSLGQASYAVLSDGKIALIDPARDPAPYLDYAREKQASVEAILLTHTHADFVGSQLELQQTTGAPIFISKKAGASYPHQPFDEGREISLGKVRLKALNTPGHSADSITVLLIDEGGRQHAVFTGDTLFVGDVGRPDLREEAGRQDTERQHLARQLYKSLREVVMPLPRELMVYPGHGAGSLCGRQLSDERSSTIGAELETNWALQQQSEEDFVNDLLSDQPHIPKYFKSAVEINKKGAPPYHESISAVPRLTADEPLEAGVLVVDTRRQLKFKNCHIQGAINLMEGPKFETWLGSILAPGEAFYLLADDMETLNRLISKAAKIGYETSIKGAVIDQSPGQEHDQMLILEHFKAKPENYTVLDVRNREEVQQGKLFAHATAIPLHQLRERIDEVSTEKPIVVHCAAGYRSAAAYSIARKAISNTQVYDLGEAVKDYM